MDNFEKEPTPDYDETFSDVCKTEEFDTSSDFKSNKSTFGSSSITASESCQDAVDTIYQDLAQKGKQTTMPTVAKPSFEAQNTTKIETFLETPLSAEYKTVIGPTSQEGTQFVIHVGFLF